MSGMADHNLRMFQGLCGDGFAGNVVFLSTMWDKVRNVKAAEQKEASLKERYWNTMIYHGATVERFHVNGSGFESPWLIVDKMIQRHQPGQALLLQEEIVDAGKQLHETNAGRSFSWNLRRPLIKQNRAIELPRNRGRTDADIQKEMDALRLEIEEEFESMKIPLGRRLALFFGKALGRESDR
jgi:hypothetical protein